MSAGSAPILGAIEGGGTTFRVAVGTGPDDVVERQSFPTTTADETLARVIEVLGPHRPAAVGVAMFGPLELRASAGEARGSTLRTPKPGWDSVPVRARLAAALGAEVTVDTDVNGAALAEARVGAARGADPVVYVTVGTGVGFGVVVGGQPLHGLLHPELGHAAIVPDDDDSFPGTCPFHGRCLEGMAAGPALERRIGGNPASLREDHPELSRIGRYVGRGLAMAVLALSPERIVLGGGVGRRPAVLEAARRELVSALAGYVPRDELGPEVSRYVVAPALEDAGLTGAWLLARPPERERAG